MDRRRKQELDDLYKKYAKPLYYFLLRLSGSPSIAEDLVQETFIKATISLSIYKEEEAKAWLFKVSRFAYLDEWRKRKRWKWVSFLDTYQNDMVSPYGQPESELVKNEVKADIEAAIQLLPEIYRSVIYLREFEEFSYEELAQALELNLNQVKVTLYRARKKLKDMIEFSKEDD